MTKKTIYLSGKMTGLPNYGFDIFDKNRDFLINSGWDVISPADIDREEGFDPVVSGAEFTEEQYLEVIKRDYAALLKCDAIGFLNNWADSRGAKLESDFANVLKLDRYRVDADRDYLEKELVVAFLGYARSGKNTLAEEFVKNDGFDQRGFADALKSILYSLNPILPAPNWTEVGDDFGTAGVIRVKDYVDAYGYEESKKVPEIRQLLQRLGTEGGRVALGTDIWVNTLFSRPHGARLAISDLRFENEAAAVKARGGYVIRVERPGVGPANNHASEKLDFEADYTVYNNRTPHEAYLDVVGFLVHQGIYL